MNLILDIISGNAQNLGAARRKVFGPEGGRIGRAPDCDWVLENPYVSRHHATIRWISGTYFIESAGENGVAIGGPQAMIPKLERRALKHGDHLFIDEYEIIAQLDAVASDRGTASSAGAAAQAFAPTDDPFDLGSARQGHGVVDPLEPASEELDPLKQLGAGSGAALDTAPREESSWNHTPGVSDHFAPPAPAPPSPVEPVIPADWDKTTFGRAASAPSGPPPPASPSIPDDWDKTSFTRKSAPAAVPPTPTPTPTPGRRPQESHPAGAARRPAPSEPMAGERAAASSTPAPVGRMDRADSAPGAMPAGSPAPAAPPAGVSPAPAGEPQRATGAIDVAALFKSAGVDPASVPADLAGSLGLILRSVVQGVIDVLRARAQIKEQFRLSQTIVKTAENNPLKFAVNAEDALVALFGQRNPAYLPPVEAFDDAFADLRFHQLAMLAGMRAGFEHVLSQFDPQQLAQSVEKSSRRGGLLSMSAKSRYWERFTEQFQELAGDRERAFRRLFAEEFAAAYEKQLEVLKRTSSPGER